MYTFWKRSVPPPALSTMGAPGREVCTTRRSTVSTPLDALVLMNDPTYVEAARGLAQRMLRAEGMTARQRIAYGFHIVTSRRPADAELNVLEQILTAQRERFAGNAEAANELISVGESAPDSRFGADLLASYTVIASMLLNLHEAISRG